MKKFKFSLKFEEMFFSKLPALAAITGINTVGGAVAGGLFGAITTGLPAALGGALLASTMSWDNGTTAGFVPAASMGAFAWGVGAFAGACYGALVGSILGSTGGLSYSATSLIAELLPEDKIESLFIVKAAIIGLTAAVGTSNPPTGIVVGVGSLLLDHYNAGLEDWMCGNELDQPQAQS